MASRSRVPGVLRALGLLALIGSVAFGANLLGIRDDVLGSPTPAPRPPALSRVAGSATTAAPNPAAAKLSVLQSQPWWQGVATQHGTGSSTVPTFTIAGSALQWRVSWKCDSGHLTLPSPSRAQPLIDADCPANGIAYATRPGATTLRVHAGGPWQIQVEQQVDVPLVEPPLPAMSAPGAVTVATASLYRIDQVGNGKVTFYRLADGSYALRLEDFFITANIDLELRLSPLEAPHTTAQYQSAPSALVAPLDITTGSLNFTVPAGVDPTKYRSLVVWCPLITSAYAAATLKPGP